MISESGRKRADFEAINRPAAAAVKGGAKISSTGLLSAGKRGHLEHDPEKWTPVFRKDHAQTKR
jgi:hypothetical protein